MTKFKIITVALGFIVPLFLGAAPFEGTMTMTAISPRGDPMAVKMSMKEGMMRMDMEAQGQEMSMIMDQAKETATVLVHQQKMYMVRPVPKAAPAAAEPKAPDVTIEKTSEHEKILGYEATKYIAKSKDATTEVWMTEELGTFMGFGKPGGAPMGRQGKGSALDAWEDAFRGKELFPLRVSTKTSDGKQTKMEVTAVEKKKLDASVFAAPSDYQDMQAMMGGMPGARPQN